MQLNPTKQTWTTLSTIGSCILILCLFSFDKGYIIGSSILLLISIVAGFKKQLSWHENLTFLTAAFIISLLPYAVNSIQDISNIGALKKAARGLPFLLIAAFWITFKPKKEITYIAFSIALIISFGIMLNSYMSGLSRAYQHGFSINTLLISIVACIGLLLPQTLNQNPRLRILIYIAVTLTTASIMISQSKGPLLTLLSVMLIFSILTFKKAKKNLGILWLLMICSSIVTSQLTNNELVNRVTLSTKNTTEFIKAPNKEPGYTSTGIRLEMWHTAIILAGEKPIFGYGKSAMSDRIYELADKGIIAPYMKRMSNFHLHSVYFQALGCQGILGLISVLFLFIIPGYILFKQRKIKPTFSFGGGLVIVSYLVGGISESPLTATTSTFTYFMLITLCISQVTTKKEQISKNNLSTEIRNNEK